MTYAEGRSVLRWAVLALLIAIPVQAQETGDTSSSSSTPNAYLSQFAYRPVVKCDVKSGIKDVAELVQEYSDWTSWQGLQTDLRRIIESCVGVEVSRRRPLDVVLILGSHTFHVMVPQSEPYRQTVFNGTRLGSVLILNDNDAPTADPSVGLSEQQVEHPLQSQLPDFVQSLAKAALGGNVSHFFGLEKPTVPAQETPKLRQIYVYASAPARLPFARGVITESGTLVLPATITKVAGDKDDSNDDGTTAVPLSTTYVASPRSRFDVATTGSGIIGRIRGPRQATIDSGNYTEQPVARLLTMAAAAWHPWPYDSTEPRMTWQERLSVLGGGVLTPDPGIGTGVSWGVVRGLAANIGYFWIWVPTAANGAAMGTVAPTNVDEQFIRKINRGVFVGGGYVFKASS